MMQTTRMNMEKCGMSPLRIQEVMKNKHANNVAGIYEGYMKPSLFQVRSKAYFGCKLQQKEEQECLLQKQGTSISWTQLGEYFQQKSSSELKKFWLHQNEGNSSHSACSSHHQMPLSISVSRPYSAVIFLANPVTRSCGLQNSRR